LGVSPAKDSTEGVGCQEHHSGKEESNLRHPDQVSLPCKEPVAAWTKIWQMGEMNLSWGAGEPGGGGGRERGGVVCFGGRRGMETQVLGALGNKSPG